jgi:hypothetical protein
MRLAVRTFDCAAAFAFVPRVVVVVAAVRLAFVALEKQQQYRNKK